MHGSTKEEQIYMQVTGGNFFRNKTWNTKVKITIEQLNWAGLVVKFVN